MFLWRARLAKTRTLAAGLVRQGCVRRERSGELVKLAKAASEVRAGDRLSLRRGGSVTVLEIIALPHRRGPASEAQACYRSLQDPAQAP